MNSAGMIPTYGEVPRVISVNESLEEKCTCDKDISASVPIRAVLLMSMGC